MPLASCASSFLSGVAKRDSRPFGNARHPCRTLKRAIPNKNVDARRCIREGWITAAWMQEVGGKMLLHFPHSPHPCSLATHGAVAETRKSFKFQISKGLTRVVIRHIAERHMRLVTPRMNIGSCFGSVCCAANRALQLTRRMAVERRVMPSF